MEPKIVNFINHQYKSHLTTTTLPFYYITVLSVPTYLEMIYNEMVLVILFFYLPNIIIIEFYKCL